MNEPKFHVGQMVRYIGRLNKYSPEYGAIGKVLKINSFETNFLVEFNNFIYDGLNYWYHEDELEAVDDVKNEVKFNSACLDWIR